MRRPLYGGERGVRSRADTVKEKLLQTAQADFFHDFGEGVPERDKYRQEDLQRFQEIAQGYGISKYTAIVAGFNSVLGKNPYTLLNTTISSRIFPYPGDPTAKFQSENEALLNLGIDYGKIKDAFGEKIKAAKTAQVDLGTTVFSIPDITFGIPGTESRTYQVSGVLMKDKEGAGVFNVASRFELVTGGKKNIALVIDASGGLSMTSLINTDIEPLPNNKMNFYILENIENESDSATKVKTFDIPKIQDPSRLEKQANVYFLKDNEDTVLYPSFKLDQSVHNGELLFGNADLVLSRANDETEADFTFTDKSTYHIENVSQNANVKNASLNILASALSRGGTIENDKLKIKDNTPYLFPYIKRVGDWCQALSLLDGSRVYTDNIGNPTTLDDIRKDSDSVVGLLTLDRILLGYALTLGIDVFFTTATDLRLLIYFRNTETTLTEEESSAKVNEIKPVFESELMSIGQDKVRDILQEGIQYVQQSATNTEYIQRLRGTLYRLSVLRSDFAGLSQKVQEITVKVADPSLSSSEKYTAYFEGLTLLRKLKADEKHNETQRVSFPTYPAYVDEKSVFTTIDIRPESRAAISKLKQILSKDLFNDAVQVKKLFAKYGMANRLPEFLSVPIKEPNALVFQNIFESLGEVRTLFGVPQTGGGIDDINQLKQFEITPVSPKQYETFLSTPLVDDLPIPLVKWTYYRDKKLLPYTVVDNFMITKEDIPTFERIINNWPRSAEDEKFVATRFMLLYADMLRGELEKLVASEDDIIESDSIQPSDVKAIGHKRIYYKAANLLDIYGKFLLTNAWKYAAIESLNVYNGTNLLDNESINKLSGRDALRSDDYNKTYAKIQTLRQAIVTYLDSPKRATLGKRQREGGGLQSLIGISTNVQGIDIPGIRTVKHPRLRERARTRRATRVRQ